MALAAAQVIDAIAARLTGLALAGDRVYTSRAWPLAEDSLPAWRVIAADEDVEPITIHGPALEQHTLQVELHGFARTVSDLDDALHALAAQALTAIFSVSPPADLLTDIKPKLQITLRRIERTLTKEGEAALGLVLLTLRVIFRVKANTPEILV